MPRKGKPRCRKPLKTLDGEVNSQSKAFVKEEGLTKGGNTQTPKQIKAKEEREQKRKRKEILKDIYSAIDKAIDGGGQRGGRLKMI